ncbi:hypothetical protein A1O1_02265 [Capronia coronata CBS 617.96]|uniref:Uncharacterized protein n=1 Tax=Capronia coronata CBS 617.96 TaxID=1182541 RepID=W9YLW9_9EURO|nr:uncharacterized protein A1O1_02265 [Capronia coronata CBS 617.96]EXJ93872.1 hypothetical protein A1O1_02265 [Capronia coronata CBS 617.96]
MSITITYPSTSRRSTTMDQQPTASFQLRTSDPVSRFLDEPFKTWPSTILFAVILMAIGGVAIFLGRRYMETLRFHTRRCCETPLTLEGQRSQLRGNTEASATDQSADWSDIGFWDDQESDVRRRAGLGHIRPGAVAIGEVREGKIAQRRRASSSRKA